MAYDVEPTPPTPAPPFPLQALPTTIADYAAAVAASFPVAVDLAALPVLAFLAGAIGNSCRLRLKASWSEGATLWIAVISPPGTAKTPVLTEVGHVLYQQQADLLLVFREALRRFDDEQATWERASKRDRASLARPERPLAQRLIVDDTTVERLGELLGENPRGLLLSRDELAGWIHSQNEYKGGRGSDRSKWLSIWSGRSTVIDRKLNPLPIFVERPFVSVVGGLQPDLLPELRDPSNREDGFTDRILFGWPDTSARVWTEVTVPEIIAGRYQAMIAWLSGLVMETDEAGHQWPVLLDLSERGKAAWVERYNAHHAEFDSPQLDGRLHGAWAKLDSYAARLSLIVHLVRVGEGTSDGRQADETSVEAGWQLVDYFKAMAARVYDVMGWSEQDRQVEQTIAWLRARSLESLSLREAVHRRLGGVRTAEAGLTLFRQLVGRGYGLMEESHGPGRTRVVLRLRPANRGEEECR